MSAGKKKKTRNKKKIKIKKKNFVTIVEEKLENEEKKKIETKNRNSEWPLKKEYDNISVHSWYKYKFSHTIFFTFIVYHLIEIFTFFFSRYN